MAVKTSNEQIRDALTRHQTYLLRYSGYVRNRIFAIMDATEESLAARIMSRLAGNTGLTTPVEIRRQRALIESIAKLRHEAWDKVDDLLKEEMVALSLAESVSLSETLRIALPVRIETAMPTTRLLRAIALSRPFQGAILSEWVQEMSRNDLRLINNAVQQGMVAGEAMDTIARRVVGSTIMGGRDGTTELTRHQVAAITRTAVMHISNASRSAFLQENADIVEMEYFVATLDSRTTPVCRANDGKTFELGTGPVPPLHFQCRSLRIAAIDGTLLGDRPAKPFIEKDLVSEYAQENKLGDITRRADLPYGTKTDFDKWKRGRIRDLVGPIPASTTYQQWLTSQSTSFQNEILGTTKARLFRDGGLELDRFVDRGGNELTLADLARTEKDAFRAAGLNPDDF